MQKKLYSFGIGLQNCKNESHVQTHPLRGALFENMIIADKIKQSFNKAEEPSLYYFRDNTGNEADLLEEIGGAVVSYEIKASKTLSRGLFRGLDFYKKLNPHNKKSVLIYTGDSRSVRYGHECLPYKLFAKLL